MYKHESVYKPNLSHEDRLTEGLFLAGVRDKLTQFRHLVDEGRVKGLRDPFTLQSALLDLEYEVDLRELYLEEKI